MVKWGIIAPGRIAQKFANDLTLVEGGQLMAVASRSEERAKNMASKYGAAKWFGSYHALVKSGEVDIVYIASPNAFHKEHTCLCLDHGIPVLCEKPAALNLLELSAMIETSKRNKTFFMEALWTRFLPAIGRVLEIIESNEMGQVESVEADFCFKAPFDPESRLYDLSLGGGTLLDIGIYPLFLAYLLLGIPQKIEASGKLASTGADQTVSMLLNYADKMEASLHASILYPSDMTARITMQKGYLLINPRWHEAQSITIIKAGYEAFVEPLPTLGHGFSHEIRECHRCLANQQIESELWSHQDSVNMMTMMDEIRRQIGVIYPNRD